MQQHAQKVRIGLVSTEADDRDSCNHVRWCVALTCLSFACLLTIRLPGVVHRDVWVADGAGRFITLVEGKPFGECRTGWTTLGCYVDFAISEEDLLVTVQMTVQHHDCRILVLYLHLIQSPDGLRGADIARVNIASHFIVGDVSLLAIREAHHDTVAALREVFVQVLNCGDTVYDLDIDMCCILKAEEWILGDHPPIVHREMLPTNHNWMGESPVGWLSAAVLNSKVAHRRALTKGLLELLLTAPFHTGARHTRRVGVDSSAGAMQVHASDDFVQLEVPYLVGNLGRYDAIDVGCISWFVFISQNQKNVSMWKAAFLVFSHYGVSDDLSKSVMLEEVLQK